jgi:hypothetical protein
MPHGKQRSINTTHHQHEDKGAGDAAAKGDQ